MTPSSQSLEPPQNPGRFIGHDLAITELALAVSNEVGYRGRIINDSFKPDEAPRKLLDCSHLSDLGWNAKISLKEELHIAYQDFLSKFNVETL